MYRRPEERSIDAAWIREGGPIETFLPMTKFQPDAVYAHLLYTSYHPPETIQPSLGYTIHTQMMMLQEKRKEKKNSR